MMKVIIIDDDSGARNSLAEKLDLYDDINLVGMASDGTKGLELMKEKKPDLLFLDVEMPEMSGLDFLEQISNDNKIYCHIVMYTSYEGYMLSSFRNNAFDFLLKPIDDNELDKIIKRCIDDYKKGKDTSSLSLGFEISNPNEDKILFYINSTDFRLVHFKDICMFQYNRDLRTWEAIIADNKVPIRLKHSTTKDSLIKLNKQFVQVNQKYIVNVRYLLEVSDNICRFYPPFDNIEYVKVGRLYRKNLIEQFNSI